MKYGIKNAPEFVNLTENSKKYLKQNIEEIKKLQEKVLWFFNSGTDTAFWHRRELNAEIRRLKKENTEIRKGFKVY